MFYGRGPRLPEAAQIPRRLWLKRRLRVAHVKFDTNAPTHVLQRLYLTRYCGKDLT